jgi:choline dehydrogenase-like flavoprotein
MPEPVFDGKGPGVTIASRQFLHGNPGLVGGGMLANEFVKLPIITWAGSFPPGKRRWGLDAKRWMRENYTRVIQVNGPAHDIPSPESRVRIDPAVRDKYGIPAIRRSGNVHAETRRVVRFLRARAIDWLKAAGATDIWYPSHIGLRSGGQHQAGTCRMGADPRTSVCDPFGRVHGHDNLYVVDGSLHVTAGGLNPALTIMALAFRCAEAMASPPAPLP